MQQHTQTQPAPAEPGSDAEEPISDSEAPARAVRVDRSSGLYRRSSRQHGRGHGGGSREVRLKRQLLVARIFAACAIAAGVVLAILLIRAQSQLANTNADSGMLASELNRTRAELDQAKQLLAAQDVEMGALVKQRIPGATTLELEKLYEVNREYVKKVSFSESGVGDDLRVTYYAVLKNTGSQPVTPGVTILLFDRNGLQTGSARIERAAATTTTEGPELQPGETRSYSAPVEQIRPGEPSFFAVEIR